MEVEVSGVLFLRDTSRGETIQLDAGAACGPCESGGGVYQDATADGSRVFFTTTHRLTEGSGLTGARPLYECRIEVDAEGHLACRPHRPHPRSEW